MCAVSIAYAYFGSLAHGVGEILAGRVRLSTGAFLLSVLISGVLLAAALGLAAVYTKRAIQRYSPSLLLADDAAAIPSASSSHLFRFS